MFRHWAISLHARTGGYRNAQPSSLYGELELTALSLHAYAYLADKYMLCSCGASFGDDYGPMVVAKQPLTREFLQSATIAVPGTLTTAFLSMQLWLGGPCKHVAVPFNEMLDIVEAGTYNGQKIDAGLVIHEGQLTYREQGLHLIEDMGKWWKRETGLPLPLGANGVRKDLGLAVMTDINRYLYQSIKLGWSIAVLLSTMRLDTDEGSSETRPMNSSACMSTIGRSTLETAAAPL